jgi:hypothetical protein
MNAGNSDSYLFIFRDHEISGTFSEDPYAVSHLSIQVVVYKYNKISSMFKYVYLRDEH